MNLFLALMLTASQMTDAGLTAHNMQQPGRYELNPIARPFVTHGEVLTYSSFAATTAGELYLIHRLRVSGHSKAARVVTVSLIGLETAAVAYSVTH